MGYWRFTPALVAKEGLMDSLNICALTGWVDNQPSLVEATNLPEHVRFTLRCEETAKTGQVFKMWIPLEVWGHLTDPAMALMPGDMVAISGALKWRASVDKAGEKKGTLTVFLKSLTCLSTVEEEAG
jgi:single-stranded DNA-binding protein